MKLILGLILSLVAVSAFGQTRAPVSAVKTLQILGVDAGDQGSLVVASGEQAVRMAASLGVQAPRQQLVVVTGNAVNGFQAVLRAHGVRTFTSGSGDSRLLVFADDGACDILKVLGVVFGEAFQLSADGITIVKGGLSDVLGCLEQALAGTIALGIDAVTLSAELVCCTADVLVSFAEFVYQNGGICLLRTANGVILVAGFAARTLCDVITCTARDAFAVSTGAVQVAYHIVGGVIHTIGNVLAGLGRILFGHCHDGAYYVNV